MCGFALGTAAYLFLLTDVYPPFEFAEAQYPVRLRAEPGPLNRLAVMFRIILVIPAAIISAILGYGLSFLVMFVTWLIVLIAGQMPRPLHEALAATVRYHVRVTGYFLMVTARYPGGLFGDPAGPAFVPVPAGDVAVMLVSPLTLIVVAELPPKDTAVALVKLVPVIVTAAPPADDPRLGEIDVTVGCPA